jgi:hypothetical protein
MASLEILTRMRSETRFINRDTPNAQMFTRS